MPVDVSKTLRQALDRLESERGRIDRQISALRLALSGAANGRPAPGRRRMSPAARRAVSQRMKAYWAARKASRAGGKTAKAARAQKIAKPSRAEKSAK